MALFEDARVEALAVAELPGLARLWKTQHTATPESGADFETLLQRLARALADPAYDDPHPWVRKGCVLCYGERRQGLPLLQTATDIRSAAMRLGHDIGQMRMQFNAKTYRSAPAYRDDHRWMWTAEMLSAPPPAKVAVATQNDDPAVTPPETLTRYAEWDRLITRLRPGWCSVFEQTAHAAANVDIDSAELMRHITAHLRRPLRALAQRVNSPLRRDDGEWFDLGALVDWQVARRRRNADEPRVYRAMEDHSARAAVWLLIDQSASTADVHVAGAQSVLQTATVAVAALANALEQAGVDCTVAGFNSSGRHAVRVNMVKQVHEAAGNGMQIRLQALRAGGSTRLGAVLRHASARLAQQGGGPRWVILFSDGEPYDIDVHDPRYLVEDARHAVRAAARRDVRVVCLAVAANQDSDARRIFGRPGVQALRDAGDLPRALSRLLT